MHTPLVTLLASGLLTAGAQAQLSLTLPLTPTPLLPTMTCSCFSSLPDTTSVPGLVPTSTGVEVSSGPLPTPPGLPFPSGPSGFPSPPPGTPFPPPGSTGRPSPPPGPPFPSGPSGFPSPPPGGPFPSGPLPPFPSTLSSFTTRLPRPSGTGTGRPGRPSTTRTSLPPFPTGTGVPLPPAPGTPAPNNVSISSLTYTGSGCPAGTLNHILSSDSSDILLAYSSLTASTGPGASAQDTRRNCLVSLSLSYPAGYQYSVVKSVTRGFAQIPAGDLGTARTTWFFQGQQGATSGEYVARGPTAGDYEHVDTFDTRGGSGNGTTDGGVVVSPCGGAGGQRAVMNVNTEVFVTPDGAQTGLMTVDSLDEAFTQTHYIQWSRC